MKNGNIRFEYPSLCLDQANHKNNCQNFPTQKNLEIKNSNCPQILQSSLSLEIRSTPTFHHDWNEWHIVGWYKEYGSDTGG